MFKEHRNWNNSNDTLDDGDNDDDNNNDDDDNGVMNEDHHNFIKCYSALIYLHLSVVVGAQFG